MLKLTLIAQVTDGQPLAELMDEELDLPDADFYKKQAKSLFSYLSKGQNEPSSKMSLETGPYVFHYFIEGHVHYLTMCDRSYPKKLAFQYLEDLKNEFERVNGSQIETAASPDTFIQKIKELYQDTTTKQNIAKLNDERYEVDQIMTRNVKDVLGSDVSMLSSRLTSEFRIYADKGKDSIYEGEQMDALRLDPLPPLEKLSTRELDVWDDIHLETSEEELQRLLLNVSDLESLSPLLNQQIGGDCHDYPSNENITNMENQQHVGDCDDFNYTNNENYANTENQQLGGDCHNVDISQQTVDISGCECIFTSCSGIDCKCFLGLKFCTEKCNCKGCRNNLNHRFQLFNTRRALVNLGAALLAPVFDGNINDIPRNQCENERQCSCLFDGCLGTGCPCFMGEFKCNKSCMCYGYCYNSSKDDLEPKRRRAFCNCKTIKCNSNNCGCHKLKTRCSKACKCLICENQFGRKA